MMIVWQQGLEDSRCRLLTTGGVEVEPLYARSHDLKRVVLLYFLSNNVTHK